MAHIKLPHGKPGILGPLSAYRETEKHLTGLANALMRGPSSLSEAEREVIAAFVSAENECYFCTQAHAAAARQLLGDKQEVMEHVLQEGINASVDKKLQALLVIAGLVRIDGRLVTFHTIRQAREAGADDKAIHDTILIASMFCMLNRYVDGLATWTPQDSKLYENIGNRLATEGYVSPIQEAV